MISNNELMRIAAKVAHRIRAITVKDTVPFRTGELRKSIHVSSLGYGYLVGTNKVYARAVHEGRKALVIKPKNKKALYWGGAAHPVKKVFQKARKGKPFFREAVSMFADNIDQEAKSLGIESGVADELKRSLEASGLNVKRIS
ncbi:MAG: hypothetical protein Q4F74_02825 [Synergistaceae bacterium]|nr:hypothetical protein [Synergistaceae bacterium]